MKKLTPRMLELLAVLKKGEERVIYMPYRGRFNQHAYYFSFGLNRGENGGMKSGGNRCTREAEGLLARGLAAKHMTNKYDGSHDLVLSDADRALDAS